MLSSAESEEKCSLGVIICSPAQPWHNRHEKSCKTNIENMKQLSDPEMPCYVKSVPLSFYFLFLLLCFLQANSSPGIC